MPDEDPPPPKPLPPHLSGEVTASARGRLRPTSLINEPPDVDDGNIRSIDDGDDDDTASGRPFASAFSPGSSDVGSDIADDGAGDAADDGAGSFGGRTDPDRPRDHRAADNKRDDDSSVDDGLGADIVTRDDGSLTPTERRFGGYELLRRLAFGGMGEVFVGRRRGVPDAPFVVVKRVLAHMRRDDKHRRMFLDEATLQRMLRSSHIVQIHDVGDHDGMVFLAMEHVHGPSWRSLIDRCRRRRQHIPVAYVVEMLLQACDALSYAHNLFDDDTGLPLKVVHRDINPHNVLVTYDGVVKVIDFGIARSELREQQTETGTIKGKFAYMSPEQSAAEPLDARSDLFALGICLYELLTLTNPFKRSNIVLSLEAIQKTSPKSVADVRPGAAILAPIVERMLRKNPDDRFYDCAEVATALRALRADGLIVEPRAPLSAWLHELFAVEIDEHERIIAAALDHDDSGPTSTSMSTSTTSSTVTLTPAPATSPTAARTLTPVPQVIALPVTPSVVAAPPRRRRFGAFIGVAAVGLAVATVLVLRAAVLPPPLIAIVDAGPRVAVVVPIVDAGFADAGVVDAGFADAGFVDAGVVDAGVVDAGNDDDDAVPVKKPKKTPTSPTTTTSPPVEAAAPVAKVAISAEGFVVKGARSVPAGGSTVLVVDDADAPFSLRLRIVAGDDGGTLELESTPWAVVRVDQVGQGRTPLQGVLLKPSRKALISLQNPAGAKMDLQVTYTPVR